MLGDCCGSYVVCFGFLLSTDISVHKINVDGKKKKTTHTVEKHFSDILKYPMVYVDVCFAVMAPAFLQVLAEFHNKALHYINCKAQNAALSRSRAPGLCIMFTSIPRHGCKWLMANL